MNREEIEKLGEELIELGQGKELVSEATRWSDIYDDGECPDCGDPIPEGTPSGGECENCGHVFWGKPVRGY